MSNILLFLSVIIAIASIASLSTNVASVISTNGEKLCTAVPKHPKLATALYNELTNIINAYPNAQTYLTNTVAIINNPNEKTAFLAGGTTCEEFLIYFEAAVQADLNADKITAQAKKQKLLQDLETLIVTFIGILG